MNELKRWWPSLVLLVGLSVALIIRHPLMEQMTLLALVTVTLLYTVATDKMSRATAKLAEISMKPYDPDLVVYAKDRYPSHNKHLMPGQRGQYLQSVRWRLVLDNPGLVAILVTGFRLEIAGLRDDPSDWDVWKGVQGGLWRAVEDSGQEVPASEPFRVEPRAPGLALHLFLCTQDVPALLSQASSQTRVYRLKGHFEYEVLGQGPSRQRKATEVISGQFYVDGSAKFGEITEI